MPRFFLRFVLALSLLTVFFASPRAAQSPAPRPSGGGQSQAPAHLSTIADRTSGMQKLDGYVPLYWDDKAGSLWMEIDKLNTEMLYTTGLAAGLGSNDIGLDRGINGPGRIVAFQRIGPRVLLVQPNYTFRSSSSSADERRDVEDAFAKSVLWGSRSAPNPTATSSSTQRISSCVTRSTSRRACVPGRTASIARAARSICRARRRFPRTAKSTSS